MKENWRLIKEMWPLMWSSKDPKVVFYRLLFLTSPIYVLAMIVLETCREGYQK